MNAKVKRETIICFAILHRQIGPPFKAVVLSIVEQQSMKDQLQKCFEDSSFVPSLSWSKWSRSSVAGRILPLTKQQSIKDQLQKCFEENSFDPLLSTAKGSRSSIAGRIATRDGNVESDIVLEVPTSDLMAALPADIISKLVRWIMKSKFVSIFHYLIDTPLSLKASNEGKTAWKMRKEALDDIDEALKGCSGLIASGPIQMKQLVELARGLRDRLTDLQINLRPTAARLVGTLVLLVASTNQAKLCKVVLAALISEALNDANKPMRDASLLAIRCSVTCPQVDGGNINVLAIEPLLNALVSEVNDAAIRVSSIGP